MSVYRCLLFALNRIVLILLTFSTFFSFEILIEPLAISEDEG
ncbi:hypothetical protein LEP1GSC058_1941 [Leptospira fainei serovar Hurstbridge str. BUT 6]|uniref:Uncharacterized protein n=1 Tax=Leptospira fainei serovar Hurstbridge str. BUT 6 TaxID=1193011 RepID=S3W4P2_9LEPT|nr:hypothetical protein LEP1GSC058_1941 [Leptospira fainei serovar Hurstbridge str. BUT 6]